MTTIMVHTILNLCTTTQWHLPYSSNLVFSSISSFQGAFLIGKIETLIIGNKGAYKSTKWLLRSSLASWDALISPGAENLKTYKIESEWWSVFPPFISQNVN